MRLHVEEHGERRHVAPPPGARPGLVGVALPARRSLRSGSARSCSTRAEPAARTCPTSRYSDRGARGGRGSDPRRPRRARHRFLDGRLRRTRRSRSRGRSSCARSSSQAPAQAARPRSAARPRPRGVRGGAAHARRAGAPRDDAVHVLTRLDRSEPGALRGDPRRDTRAPDVAQDDRRAHGTPATASTTRRRGRAHRRAGARDPRDRRPDRPDRERPGARAPATGRALRRARRAAGTT